jgi:Holliday junction resolvase RusA-like endonuclease
MTIAIPKQQLAVEFRVSGLPAPQGSKSFKGYKNGRGIMVESSKKVRPWRTDVQLAAERVYSGDVISVPVHVNVDFFFARPKSHYRTGKYSDLLKADAPLYASTHRLGDLDKLLRSTIDALSFVTGGCVIRDDCLVASLSSTKRYTNAGTPPGAAIKVLKLP